jgi:hypothetical protein
MAGRSIILALTLLLAGCAAQPAREFATPSGRPEAMFIGMTPAPVLGKLSGLCMDRGGIVMNQDGGQIVCQKTMDSGDAILATLLIGNQYSTTPVLKVRFSAAQIGPDTRVQAYEWVETQMAFGQIQTMEINSNAEFNKLEYLLQGLGGKVMRVALDQPTDNGSQSTPGIPTSGAVGKH